MNLLKRHIILTNEKKHMQMLLAIRAMRRATHTLLFTTLLLCSALASCTPAEDATDTGNPTLPADAEVPLSVQSVDIEGGLEVLTRTKENTGATTKTSAATDTRAAGETRAAMPETRATTYTELKTKGDVINILRLSNDDYPTAITEGVKYRYNGISWEPGTYTNRVFKADPKQAIKLGAKDSRELLYAFYAPDSTYRFNIYNSNGEISLNPMDITDMRWYKKGKKNDTSYSVAKYDFCYSAAGEAQAVSPATEVYNFHPGVKFSMKRLLTQLGIKVTRGDNYAGVGEIGIIIWPKNAKFNSSGSFDTKTGTLTKVNPYGGIATNSHERGDPLRHYFDLPQAGDVYEDGVLMFPPGLKLDNGMSMGNFSLVVDIEADGIKLADLTISYAKLEMLMNAAGNNFDMKAGTKYVLNLKLDYRSLELEGVQVAQWETKTLADAEAGFELDLPGVGIQVAKADINETTAAAGNAMACTENDKELLSELIWASGNAKTHSSSPTFSYEWEAQQEGVGELYNWDTAVDICKYFGEEHYDLDPNLSNIDQFGTGWRLPTKTELDALSHCRGYEDTGKNGAWFMNSTKGVLLPWTITQPGAGGRIVASNYWSGTESGSNAYCLRQASGGKVNTFLTTMAKNEKNAVRCVKKPK